MDYENGDPRRKAEENEFLAKYEYDAAAEDYFKGYTFEYHDNEKHLSGEKIREYAHNASILNTMRRVMERNV